jgi:hypothetical protein
VDWLFFGEIMSIFDRPDFKEAERKFQDEQREEIRVAGYELINISHVFPWVEEIESIKDIRHEYELREMKSGIRIGSMIDCSYFQALNWAVEKVRKL